MSLALPCIQGHPLRIFLSFPWDIFGSALCECQDPELIAKFLGNPWSLGQLSLPADPRPTRKLQEGCPPATAHHTPMLRRAHSPTESSGKSIPHPPLIPHNLPVPGCPQVTPSPDCQLREPHGQMTSRKPFAPYPPPLPGLFLGQRPERVSRNFWGLWHKDAEKPGGGKSRSGISKANGDGERVLPVPCRQPVFLPSPTVPGRLLLPCLCTQNLSPPFPSPECYLNSKARFSSASLELCDHCRLARPPLIPTASLGPQTTSFLFTLV